MFLGLDTSLSNSGLSLIFEDKNIILNSIKSERYGDLISKRFLRYYDILNKINILLSNYYNDIQCIAIESSSFGSIGSRKDQLCESKSLIIDLLLRNKNKNCEIIEVAPIQLKKFILGKVKAKGKDSKNLILKNVYKEYNLDIDDDNIADSFVLAKIAEQYFKCKNNIDYLCNSNMAEVIDTLIEKNKE